MKKTILKIQRKFHLSKIQRFYENLFHFALNGMGYGYGGEMEISGEKDLLNHLKFTFKTEGKTFFDVGANVGVYSLLLHKKFKNAKIYAFEPSRKTFKILLKETNKIKNIKPYNLGLGNKKGGKTLYCDPNESSTATLHNRKIKYNKEERIEINKLDSFCKIHNIERINFLKMDVEGNELHILKGAKNMLKNKKIDFIQLEFGIRNIDSKVFFRDFWDLLAQDYLFYRILPGGIALIKNYKENLEIFTGINYILELKKDKK